MGCVILPSSVEERFAPLHFARRDGAFLWTTSHFQNSAVIYLVFGVLIKFDFVTLQILFATAVAL